MAHNNILDELKANLMHSQAQMKVYANAKRREVVFQPGDLVCLCAQPFKLRLLAKKFNQKLSPRYYGSYTILNKKLVKLLIALIYPLIHGCTLYFMFLG